MLGGVVLLDVCGVVFEGGGEAAVAVGVGDEVKVIALCGGDGCA